MLRYPRAKGRLYELAAAIEATAGRDPYPRLLRVMQSRMAPGPDPYPRLAQAMWRLSSRQTGLALAG